MINNLVSIIIPVFNGEKYIAPTIQSCIEQTYNNVEIIVIDDCSKDKSLDIIKNYTKNKNIFMYKNENNIGVLKTCNYGVTLCKGNFILFLGQDDILPPGHVESSIKKFDANTSFVYCNSFIIDSYGEVRKKLADDSSLIKKHSNLIFELSKDNFIPSTGLIISKKYFLQCKGFNERYKNYGEWLLWINLAKIGEAKLNLDTYAFYRRHETNMTNSFKNIETQYVLTKYFNECRRYCLKIGKLRYKDKIKSISFYIFANLKFYLKCILYKFKKLKG